MVLKIVVLDREAMQTCWLNIWSVINPLNDVIQNMNGHINKIYNKKTYKLYICIVINY